MELKRIKNTTTLWELVDENDPKGLAATMLTTSELIGIAKGLPPEIMKEAGLITRERLQELEMRSELLDVCNDERKELSVDKERYEFLRKCNPRMFGELVRRNLAGEYFDEIVDGAIKARSE